MSERTKIEWTDTTWNCVRGCTKVSPGCKFCYAETFAERFRGVVGHPYEQGFDLRLVPERLQDPYRWKQPRMIFVNSMSDLFHERIPFGYIDAMVDIMERTPHHIYQVLTRRPQRARQWHLHYCTVRGMERDALPPNLWLGTSIESQEYLSERLYWLKWIPATVRFVSAEPLLSPLTFGKHMGALQWVIVGGESGAGARPCDVAWIRSIVAECRAAGVPVFVKQLGAKSIGVWEPTAPVEHRDYIKTMSRKGNNPAEWPADLRVREWPDSPFWHSDSGVR